MPEVNIILGDFILIIPFRPKMKFSYTCAVSILYFLVQSDVNNQNFF